MSGILKSFLSTKEHYTTPVINAILNNQNDDK